MGNDDGGGGLLLPALLAVGGVVLGYVYREELGIEKPYDIAIDYLKEHGWWPFDPVVCTKTCPAGQHIITSTCTCAPDTCTKTCPAGEVIDSSCNCVKATNPGSTTRIVAFGDVGSGRNDGWKPVIASMKKFNAQAVIHAGDFSYTNPKDYQKVVDSFKPAINLGANGNHDGGSFASLFNVYSNKVATVGNCSIMLLNTEDGPSSISFARANFKQMTQKWKIVVIHKPIITVKTEHSKDEGKVGALVPDFEKAGVHLVLQGHNHNYQRFPPTKGVTYVVVGTGGESHHSARGGGSGVVKFDDKNYGSLLIEATNSALNCKFITSGGKTVDSFTI